MATGDRHSARRQQATGDDNWQNKKSRPKLFGLGGLCFLSSWLRGEDLNL
jgi:hypothetical protein